MNLIRNHESSGRLKSWRRTLSDLGDWIPDRQMSPAETAPMTPTIVAEVQPPDVNLPNYGDPMSHLAVPSNGTGLGGGIGGGVSAPTVLSKVEPEYSEEARKAKWQGTVILQLVVDEHVMPQQMRVTRSLGLGLDQPGMKDGKPVPVIATIEVNFRLL